MKRIVLCVIGVLFCIVSLAQAPPNPFSCSDLQIMEPGWSCHEHMGYAMPFGQQLMNLPSGGLMPDGSILRGFGEWMQGCNDQTSKLRWVVYRFAPGYGFDAPHLMTEFVRADDRCSANGGIAARAEIAWVQAQANQVVIGYWVSDYERSDYRAWIVRIEHDPLPPQGTGGRTRLSRR